MDHARLSVQENHGYFDWQLSFQDRSAPSGAQVQRVSAEQRQAEAAEGTRTDESEDEHVKC